MVKKQPLDAQAIGKCKPGKALLAEKLLNLLTLFYCFYL